MVLYPAVCTSDITNKARRSSKSVKYVKRGFFCFSTAKNKLALVCHQEVRFTARQRICCIHGDRTTKYFCCPYGDRTTKCFCCPHGDRTTKCFCCTHGDRTTKYFHCIILIKRPSQISFCINSDKTTT